jgi:hypothetical protein
MLARRALLRVDDTAASGTDGSTRGDVDTFGSASPDLGGTAGGLAAEGAAGAAAGSTDDADDDDFSAGGALLGVDFLDRNCCSHSCARDSPVVRASWSSSRSVSRARTVDGATLPVVDPPLRLPITRSLGDRRDSSKGVARGPRSECFSLSSPSSKTELAP